MQEGNIALELSHPRVMARISGNSRDTVMMATQVSMCMQALYPISRPGNMAAIVSLAGVMAENRCSVQAIMNRIQSAYQPNQDGRQDHAVAAYPNATASVPLHETESCHQHNTQRSEPKLEKSGVMESMEIFMMGRIFASPVPSHLP